MSRQCYVDDMSVKATHLDMASASLNLPKSQVEYLAKLRSRRTSTNPRTRLHAAWASTAARLTLPGWKRVAKALALVPGDIPAALAQGIGRRPPIHIRICTLREVTQHLSLPDQRRIHLVLHELQAKEDRGASMLEALERDCNLGPLTWLDLLSGLLGANSLGMVLRDWGSRHTLEGPTVHRTDSVGRASEYHHFSEAFVLHSPLGPIESRIVLNNLQNPVTMPYEKAKRTAPLLKLGGRPMWCTFSPDATEAPFDFIRAQTNKPLAVRTALGLESRGVHPSSSHPLVLMTYLLPLEQGRIPTVADASQYSPWNYYFSPSPRGSKHGMTKPWDRGSGAVRGRPELVSEQASVAHLDLPLEVLWT